MRLAQRLLDQPHDKSEYAGEVETCMKIMKYG
jgi:hypothetical protein